MFVQFVKSLSLSSRILFVKRMQTIQRYDFTTAVADIAEINYQIYICKTVHMNRYKLMRWHSSTQAKHKSPKIVSCGIAMISEENNF